MWVMTSFGILMPAIRPDKYCPTWDDRKLQIRTRRRQELDILRAKYMQGSLGETIFTPDKDYEYRAYCTHDSWAIAMVLMAKEIDYSKFKPTTDRYEDHELHSVYNRIWAVVISALSTRKHQDEYWHSQGSDDWDWRPGSYSTSSSTAGSSKKAGGTTSSGWPDDPPMHSYSPSKGNGPEDVRPRSPLLSGGAASPAGKDITRWDDCRTPMPPGYGTSGYSESYEEYLGRKYGTSSRGVSLEKRDTSAGRDKYEPEVWDLPSSDITAGLSPDALSDDDWKTLESLLDSLPSTDVGASADPALEGMDIVTRARLEVDELQRSLGYRSSHSSCDHGWSPNAKARCRRKHSNETIKRIEEIEALIEEVEQERRSKQLAPTG